MTPDEAIVLAAPHFSITPEGELSRDSTPYPMTNRARMGVGFDYLDKSQGYYRFHYRTIKFSKPVSIKSHRMIFYLVHGHLPEEVDHIDRDRGNNNPSNLRGATKQQNCRNRKSSMNSSSRYLGVGWHKSHLKWSAKLNVNSKRVHLGYFDDEKEAASHYNLAAIESHGEFANLNDVR